MTPAAAATAVAMTSQQPQHPTATSKQTRTGTKDPVQGIPPHSDYSIGSIGWKLRPDLRISGSSLENQ